MGALRVLGPNGLPYHNGRPGPRAAAGPEVRARFDVAQTTPENINHWANADGLSAAAANSPEVRKKLRERARYERDNNSYCSGIVETVANDVVGTGPRLQVITDDPDTNERVCESFESWSAAVGLAEKLRTYREARSVDGESFAMLADNMALPTPVKLDLQLIEADQVATPDLFVAKKNAVDGIEYDRYGNPKTYHVLKQHPGDTVWLSTGWEYDSWPAARVLHWFKARRPGQRRGVPEITPALHLFAQLRRYTLAVLSAAEIAALFSVLLKSNLPPDDREDNLTPGLAPFAMMAAVRGMMTALPDGYEASQLKAEQPCTTYGDFKKEVLNEIARCLNVPFNIAAGNSSSYNYSSGRLDHQTYYRQIKIDQYFLETAVLDRVLAAWLSEARTADPGLLAGLDDLPHQWFWDGQEHVDPEKEANAQATRLMNMTATLADEWAARGYDWREKLRQIAAEQDFMREIGLSPAPAPPAPATPPPPEPGGGNDAQQQPAD